MKENKPAIEVIGEEQCAGCFGCYNSCPFDAIEMEYNDEGFFIPIINDQCENCGICQDHCPVIKDLYTENKFDKPKFYGGRSTNKETRMLSSSGGIFPEIARYVLEDSGIVFGAGWNDDLKLIHTKIKDVDGIKKLTGSKYIQSDIGNAYEEVKNELENGKKVLFVGTPCQIAALNTFVDHKNLLTVDLVCHGVPSKLLFEKYLKHLKKEIKSSIDQISFRNKEKGWADYQIRVDFQDGSVYKNHHKLDPYMRLYLQDICLRKACYDCRFQKIPRVGDITLGDFWGDAPDEFKEEEGISIVCANDERGKDTIIDLLELGLIEIRRTDFETATKGNPILKGYERNLPKNRNSFLQALKRNNFNHMMNEYIDIPNPLMFKVKRCIRKILNKIKEMND